VLRVAILLVVVSALGQVGCAREQPDRQRASRDAHTVTRLVARVGTRPIGASEVAARMAADGLDAKAALEQLVADELLAQEAERRGIGANRAEERAIERVMVRAMLDDFESELTPASVSETEVRADFEAQRDRLQIPERRRSWHILVKDSSEEGRALAESIRAEVRRAKQPKTVFDRYANAQSPETSFEIVTEELPPISRDAGAEQAYKDALFSVASPGPLRDVVETKSGWHVVTLTEILPAERTTLGEAEAGIRERLSQQKRFERIVELVRMRQAEGLVEYDDEGVALLLAMPGLPERVE
jgi:hypothetical protein